MRHLNATEGCNYVHAVCLDKVFRDSPQPEALYVEEKTGRRLVIERKTLAWPLDYIETHQNDHLLADWLFSDLSSALESGPYTIMLPANIHGARADLKRFAKSIADTILKRLGDLQAGKVLQGGSASRRWTAFREGTDFAPWSFRHSDGAPENGLVIQWAPKENALPEAPDALVCEIRRHLVSCVRKFQPYLGDRRILVIEPFGDLRYQPDSWWHRAFQLAGLPSEVPEIWQGLYEWVADDGQAWLFEKILPSNSQASA